MTKEIKIFDHYDEKKINLFLKKNKGKIVNYNPIIIEYDLVEDNSHIKIPNVTYSGISVSIEAYPNFATYDNDGEGMHFLKRSMINKVLFFANEVVFLADSKPILSWDILSDIFEDSRHEIQFYADIFTINGTKIISYKELTTILEENGIAPVEHHIGYNTRTKSFNNLSKSLENLSKSVNTHGNKVKHGLDNIANKIDSQSVKKKNKIIVIR